MKKLLLLLFVAVLGFGMTGCALPPELAGAGDAAAMAMALGQMFGGDPMSGSSVSAMSTACDLGLDSESDSDGWFDMSTDTSTVFKMRYFIGNSTAPATGTMMEVFMEAGLSGGITGYGFSMSGTSAEGSFDMTMDCTLTVSGETVAITGMTGTMSFTDAQTAETADITFTGLTVSAAGVITAGTITGTFGVYAISLTYADDGSAEGTIKEAGTPVATLAFSADGTTGTMVYNGQTYDIGTGEAL